MPGAPRPRSVRSVRDLAPPGTARSQQLPPQHLHVGHRREVDGTGRPVVSAVGSGFDGRWSDGFYQRC